MAFRVETYDDLISLGCSRYDHVLIPGGPGFAEGVTLSIIDSETWSGKPEPGTNNYNTKPITKRLKKRLSGTAIGDIV